MESWKERGIFENLKGELQAKRLGRNRMVNETERGNHPNPWVDRKSKLADRGNIYWIIFDREPTHKRFYYGRKSSVFRVQGIEVLRLN